MSTKFLWSQKNRETSNVVTLHTFSVPDPLTVTLARDYSRYERFEMYGLKQNLKHLNNKLIKTTSRITIKHFNRTV